MDRSALGSAGVVTYPRIDEQDVGIDNHPVAVFGSWDRFGLDATEKEERAASRQVRKRFEAIVREVRPSYGAITVERPMPTPRAFHRRPDDAWSMTDVYLSRSFAGDVAFRRFEAACDGLDVRATDDGSFAFTFFGTKRTRIEAAGEAFVAAVAARRIRTR